MPAVTTPGGITLEYETFGDPSDPTVLLVAGYGSQLISWAEGFCARIADGGRHVVRFDNRDAGLSTQLDDQPIEAVALTRAAARGGRSAVRELAPYTLADMAADAIDLLDGLGVDRAHVVGASMGGMIAQTMAIEHSHRLHTLTSVMSTTGERAYGQATPEAQAALTSPRPTDRAGYIASADRTLVYLSKRYATIEWAREYAAACYDRAFRPAGTVRQMAAIMASGSRADGLRELRMPTLVIHGLDDTLIEPSGGERTAELVPGARLLLVDDMGHDRPEPLWPSLCGAIVEHTAA
jgi:pimeloyl-ACP methyl ester carboxylesterase